MGMNVRRILKHFTKMEDNWIVNQDISDNIKFLRYNILDELSNVEPYDVIFCRYVLGYFEPKLQRELIAKIHKYLVPAGFLYIGMNEEISGLEDYYEPVPGIPCLYQSKLVPYTEKFEQNKKNSNMQLAEMPKLQKPNIKR